MSSSTTAQYEESEKAENDEHKDNATDNTARYCAFWSFGWVVVWCGSWGSFRIEVSPYFFLGYFFLLCFF